jgi:hypothetical protein
LAIASKAITRTARIIAITLFRIMVSCSPCWIFLHNRQNHFDKMTLLDNLIPDGIGRHAFNSVTMSAPSNAIRSGETQKKHDGQYGDKQKRDHVDLPSFLV